MNTSNNIVDQSEQLLNTENIFFADDYKENLRDMYFSGLDGAAITFGRSSKESSNPDLLAPQTGIIFNNMFVIDARKWGSRSYHVADGVVSNSEFYDIEQEHALYWSLAGGEDDGRVLKFENITASGIGGQIIQLACRRTEAPGETVYGRWPDIVIDRVIGYDTAKDPSRGSAPFSVFFLESGYISGNSGPRNISNETSGTIVIKNSFVDNSMQTENQGTLQIEGRYFTMIQGNQFLGSVCDPNKTSAGLLGPMSSDDVEAEKNSSTNGTEITKSLDDWIVPPERTLILDGNHFEVETTNSRSKIVMKFFDKIIIRNNSGNFTAQIFDSIPGSQTATYSFIKDGVSSTSCDFVRTEIWNEPLSTDVTFVRNQSTGLLEQQ